MKNIEINFQNKVSVITLGCKVNKYESDCMVKILSDNGFSVLENLEFADFYILNTCAVTMEAEKKSRQYIAKCLKLNPNAEIIVCGCASENNAEQFEKNENVKCIFGTFGKEKILEYITGKLKEKIELSLDYISPNNPTTSSTRAYLKIQDGCNNFCTYCLIPYVRGRSRSRNIDEIIKEAEILSKKHKEIVVTGIDMSDYKIDGKRVLGELLYSLKHIKSRIRIGSLEVGIVTDEFLSKLKQMLNFMPHFHLSLQSGDNRILKLMNRHYTREEYIDKCKLIYKYFPNANITTDIIVGFPTETEEEFYNTVNLAKEVKFGNIHIFPYSARKGTVALRYGDLPKSVKKERVDKLENVKQELCENYFNKNLNVVSEVLVEDKEDDYFVGYTENYIKVYMQGVKNNELVKVKLIKPYKEGMIGELYG